MKGVLSIFKSTVHLSSSSRWRPGQIRCWFEGGCGGIDDFFHGVLSYLYTIVVRGTAGDPSED